MEEDGTARDLWWSVSQAYDLASYPGTGRSKPWLLPSTTDALPSEWYGLAVGVIDRHIAALALRPGRLNTDAAATLGEESATLREGLPLASVTGVDIHLAVVRLWKKVEAAYNQGARIHHRSLKARKAWSSKHGS